MRHKWQICDRCGGEGKHDHPAFSNGISQDEWENDWDDDEREGYLEGRYDVTCSECGGSGKVKLPDVESMTDVERAEYEEEQTALAELARDEACERRMRERGIEF